MTDNENDDEFQPTDTVNVSAVSDDSYDAGFAAGREEGKKIGYQEGYKNGIADAMTRTSNTND